MAIPLWSMLTLGTELVVTGAVFYIVLHAYRTGVFVRSLVATVLSYELLFNISYMLSREATGAQSLALDPYMTALAIFHGVFSLVMFVSLVAFFIAGWRGYGRGENYFAVHRTLTRIFLSAWSLSVLSGIALFLQLYVL